MTREILKRIRLYFCPMCGTLVSCTRKMRRHPNRVCQAGKCIDYVNCRIRSIYTIGKVKSLARLSSWFISPASKSSLFSFADRKLMMSAIAPSPSLKLFIMLRFFSLSFFLYIISLKNTKSKVKRWA